MRRIAKVLSVRASGDAPATFHADAIMQHYSNGAWRNYATGSTRSTG